MGLTFGFYLIVAYGWFLNVAYIFNKPKIFKPNIWLQALGIIFPVVGAVVGYVTVYRNRKVK